MKIRLTKHRQSILDTLKGAHGAMTAAEINDKLPGINLVTIYRTLDMFVEHDLVKKLNLTGDEACYEYQSHPHHHAVCDDCQSLIHFTVDEAKLAGIINLKNFAVDHVELVVHGTCTETHQKTTRVSTSRGGVKTPAHTHQSPSK